MILAPAEAVFACGLVMHPVCLICLGFCTFFPSSFIPISMVSFLLWYPFFAGSMCIPGRESYKESHG